MARFARAGSISDKHLTLKGKAYRPGLFKCADCYDQFTVTVGTVFDRSKIKLNIWPQAVHLMCTSKKGISAKQLERMLGVTYKTAWFMSHRIREAMNGDNSTLLGGPGTCGIVEVDETYWGRSDVPVNSPRNIVSTKHKMMVVSLVERGGDKRSFHITETTVNAATLGPILKAQIAKTARLMTDEHRAYREPGKHFASHEAVSHSRKEYAAM